MSGEEPADRGREASLRFLAGYQAGLADVLPAESEKVGKEAAARILYHGTVATLQKVTKDMLGGKEVKVPVDESVKPVSLEERRKRATALNEILTKNRK